jgi:hypothetical protein
MFKLTFGKKALPFRSRPLHRRPDAYAHARNTETSSLRMIWLARKESVAEMATQIPSFWFPRE